QPFAPFLAVAFGESLVSGQGMLGIGYATSAAIGLAQLEVSCIAGRIELFGSFEVLDSARHVALPQQSAPKRKASKLVVGPSCDHSAKNRSGHIGVALRKERVAQVIAGHKVSRSNCQLGAEFSSGRFEIALAQENEPLEVMGFSETRIDFESSFKFS